VEGWVENTDCPKGENEYLFDHATWFELVRVGQAADETPLPCPVDPHAFSFGTTEGGGFAPARVWMDVCGGFVDRVVARFRAEGGTTFLCFSVEKEIAQNPARTPKKAISPTLDAALSLIEDKDGAGCDHFPFRLHQAAGDAGDDTPPGSLEDEEGVAGGFDPALPRGLGPGGRSIVGVGGRIRVRHGEGGLDIAEGAIGTRRKAGTEEAGGMNQHSLTRRGEKGKKR